MDRPELLVFDVNETLLDLAALRPEFEAALGSVEPMGEWFARMLHGSLVANHSNRYRPFGAIGVEALLMVAQKRGIALTEERASTVVGVMRELPPHADVVEGLSHLADAGIRMMTLTNGSTEAVTAQLANAGITRFFEMSLSVDEVGRFKPAPETYIMTSVRTGVELDRIMMVAAHDWDIIGARSVGMPGAYIARPGAIWSIPDPPAEIVVGDIGALAKALT